MTAHDDVWDWDAWVASRVDQHVESIAERLRNRPEAVAWRAARAEAARLRITIDPQSGRMPAGLCWVCAAARVEVATRTTPTFRACPTCRVYDRAQAQRLGLVMVLPLMQYPTQPVAPGAVFPADPATVAALRQAWSQVSVLDRWRGSVVRAVLARQAWPDDEPITLDQFQAFVPRLPMRSRMAWWAYVDRHQPDLASILDALPGAPQLRRWPTP